jgi:hypothetical protein
MDEATPAPAEPVEAPPALFKADEEPALTVPVEPEPEPAPEPAPEPEPEPTPDPQDRAIADLVRREAALQQKERSFKGLEKAQQALSQGNHLEAIKALGIDPNQALRDVWGEDLLPEREPAKPEEEISSIKAQLDETRKELTDTRQAMAKYRLYGDIAKAEAQMAGEGKPLEVIPWLASQAGDSFYDNLLQEAHRQENETGQRPSWPTILSEAEETYTNRYCNIVQDLLKLKGVRERLNLPKQEQAPEPDPPKPAAKPQTITTRLTSESPRQATRPMTFEERREAARKAMADAVTPDED